MESNNITPETIKANVLKLQQVNATPQDIEAYVKSASQNVQKAPTFLGLQQGQNSIAQKVIGQPIQEALKSGIEQTTQNYGEAVNAKDPLTLIEKSVGATAGVINTALSPLAPIFAPLGMAVNAIADKISNNPDLQKFAQGEGGKILKRVTEDVNNLNTIAGAVAGAKGAPEVKTAVGSAVDTGVEGLKTGVGAISETAKPLITEARNTIGNVIPGIADNSPEGIVSNRLNSLQQIENNNKPLRNIVTNATARGIDVKKLVADTDLLEGSVDSNGNIDTLSKGGAIDQFNKEISPYEGAVTDALIQEGKSIPFSDVADTLNKAINESRVAGGAKTTLLNTINKELRGLRLDSNPDGTIDLSKLQDAKISTTNEIDYNRASSKINAKMVANVYKKLIEDNSSLPVKEINADLSKFYTIQDYLEALNGKKVAGGKLGKYFAQTIGAIAGSHFGPLGAIIGEHLGGRFKGGVMESTFGKAIGKNIEATDLLKKTIQDTQEKSLGNQTNANTTAMPNATNIPKVNKK